MKKVIKNEDKKGDDKKFKKYLKWIIVIGLLVFFIVGFSYSNLLKGKYKVEIKIKEYGSIIAELDADTAPITVTNFIKLVDEKFYDGLTFHRIIEDFMIQGGDPDANGTGNAGYSIKGEFANNGYNNDISHVRGTISMARGSDKDSASSQFFIVQKDSTHLDGDYAAFGKVTKGMEIVDKIAKDLSKLGDDNGLIPNEKQPKIEYIKVIEK